MWSEQQTIAKQHGAVLDDVKRLIVTRCHDQIERRDFWDRCYSKKRCLPISFYKLFLPFLKFPLLQDIQKRIFMFLFLFELSNDFAIRSYYNQSFRTDDYLTYLYIVPCLKGCIRRTLESESSNRPDPKLSLEYIVSVYSYSVIQVEQFSVKK